MTNASLKGNGLNERLEPSVIDLAETFLSFSVMRMERVEQDIRACVNQLSEEQSWYRRGDYENSVANLLLHLDANLRQWILHGVDGQPDVRKRDQEFALERSGNAANILEAFCTTLADCRRVIGELRPERLMEVTDPQPGGGWGSPTILEAIYLVVGHLQTHAGQIVLLTKQMVGHDLDLSIPRKR